LIEIHKLTLADALHVVSAMREEDRYAIKAALGPINDEVLAVNRFQTEGPAWSMVIGDEPVAIFGVSMHTAWSGVAWLISTHAMTGESWRKLIRHCRTVIANLDSGPAHRIEAHVMADWPGAVQFARRVGMEFEGTRHKAGRNGQDVQMWAIVRQ